MPKSTKVPQLISVKKAAEILGSSEQAVFKMVYRRQLHSTKLGTAQSSPRRIYLDSLLSLIAAGETPADEQVTNDL